MKKKANFIKFFSTFRRIYGPDWHGNYPILLTTRFQYQLLCEGIRDVRISDTAILAWNNGGGEW